jgi:hypothetical protein
MEELVEISQFCFHLEDMQDIMPFWEWIDNRVRPEKIYIEPEKLKEGMKGLMKVDKNKYLEPEELEALKKGLKNVDENEYLIMGLLDRNTDTFCMISGIYQVKWPLQILDFDAQRLSDHRYKVEITFWDPDGWPKITIWDYLCRFMKDLSHDYPEIIETLQNSYLGFGYSPLSGKQKYAMLGISEDEYDDGISPRYDGNSARKLPGRKHLADDIWAYMEVNKRHREPSEVYKEWIKRPGVIVRHLQDSSRMFKLIIKPDWL